ncbi:MAG: glycosyltransferase family 4 protein [Pseudomonadota bacterium]
MPFYDVAGRAAFSGAENHLFTLMDGQVQAGLDVELIMIVGVAGARLQEKADALRGMGIRVTDVNYPVLGLGFTNRLLRPLILSRLNKLFRQRQDRVLHIHPLTGSGSLAALSAAMVRHQHVVISYHNNEPYLLRFPYKQAVRLMERLAQRTIAISAVVRKHLVEGIGLSPSKTKLIYYGISANENEPDKATLRHRLGLPQDTFIAGLVGRLTPQKDIPTFLKALQHLPDVHGVIIGGGELENELKVLARNLGLKNITFAGPQPDGPILMRCLDVMVLPSFFEGLGLVLLEAMVRNVPIIGSRGGAIPEILENGTLGPVFDVGDVETFVKLIEDFRTNPAIARHYADIAYARAQEKFTIAAMVQNTSHLYRDVMAA